MPSSKIQLSEFKEIYEEYFDRLCRQAYRILGDVEKSRDCAQLVFVKVWEKRLFQDPEVNLESYLSTAVRNMAITEYRKIRRDQSNENDVIGKYNIWHDTSSSSTEDLNLIRFRLNKAISNLKPKMQRIFLLHFKNGLTHAEISEILEIPKRTVEDNLARAYKLLKNDLVSDDEFMETHFASLSILLPILLPDSFNINSLQIKALKDVIFGLENVLI